MQASDLYLVCHMPTFANSSDIVPSAAVTQTLQINADCASRQNSTVWCLGIYATISLFLLLRIYISFGSGEMQSLSKAGRELGRGGR